MMDRAEFTALLNRLAMEVAYGAIFLWEAQDRLRIALTELVEREGLATAADIIEKGLKEAESAEQLWNHARWLAKEAVEESLQKMGLNISDMQLIYGWDGMVKLVGGSGKERKQAIMELRQIMEGRIKEVGRVLEALEEMEGGNSGRPFQG